MVREICPSWPAMGVRVRHLSVRGTPSRTLCAVAVAGGPTTSRRPAALRAVTPPPGSGSTTGRTRPSGGGRLVLAACATLRTCPGGSRMVSVRVLRPRRSSPPPLPSKSAVNNKPLSIYPDLLLSTLMGQVSSHCPIVREAWVD
ncbi:uncharacterized protein ACA1_280540 [Acanthamoeba castellanii str. Neff]|uniref:Uncharacterized protein n=1 Tax=Acanthamoeba castellanii (strain ATCC 30010 / Neff) TaxID=1257118 RepID=L8H987_ACACF|nr:uncharacterized protein ACA1_280540 [Acanthamoeba castellanii str. Neff]ELR21001.1 hypothetical protein ACA1_280540 [Acanthamoeba castellanii str. Neff]